MWTINIFPEKVGDTSLRNTILDANKDRSSSNAHTPLVNTSLQWLPLDDQFLKHCVFVDFEKRSKVTFENIQEVINSFSRINATIINDPAILDTVEEEFLDYQAMAESDIPNDIWEAALKSDGEHRMDIIWGHLEPKLPSLGAIALSVLVVPHSNAGEERVFSMIKKNKTDFRANLQLDGSLNSIMRIKMSHPEELLPCHK